MQSFVRWVFQCLVFFGTFAGLVVTAHAQASPEVTRGLAWLNAQVQADGSVAGVQLSIGTKLQNQTETAHALKLLATVPPALTAAIAADVDDHTEHVSRKAISLALNGVDTANYLSKLLQRRNFDNGFGAAPGYASNPTDTAWVVMALAQANQGAAEPAVKARAYLVSQLGVDGGVVAPNEGSRVQASALALLALQTASDGTTANAVQALASWLVLQQEVDGSWQRDTYLSAMALVAVSPVTADATLRNTARNYLLSKQANDGSWVDDPFLTALVLRALSAQASLPPASGGVVKGVVVDRSTNVPLAGASVTLSGPTGQVVTSGSDGVFQATGLGAGTYALVFTRSGYNQATAAVVVNVGQTSDLATVGMLQLATAGILRGQVISGTTLLPMAGVNVSVSGAASGTKVTDVDGRYEMTGLAPGASTVTASFAGYQTATGTGTIVAGQTLVFSPTLYANGQVPSAGMRYLGKVVIAGQNTPLSGVNIQVTGTAGSSAATTSVNGQFDLSMASGSYNASFSLPGYGTVTQAFVGSAGTTVDAGMVGLSPVSSASRIRGRVLSAANVGIAGATVQVVGASNMATTAANGSYSIDNVAGTTLTVRASAAGFSAQSVNLQLSQPTDVLQDFTLAPQSTGTFAIGTLAIAPPSIGRATDVKVTTTIANTGTTEGSAIIQLQVRDQNQNVVGNGIAQDLAGNPIGRITLAAGQQQEVVLVWNSAQHPAGTYTLAVRLVEAGSITSTTPLGSLLAERAGSVVVIAQPHLTGSITANPPVLQAGTNTPVKLSAVVQNDGNSGVAAQAFTLTAINTTDGSVAHTQQIAVGALAVNALQTLTFQDWTPLVGGNFRLELTAADASLGRVIGSLYVGDSGRATYSVNKLVVPVGTQTVRGTVAVTGQDVLNGSISDPLAVLVKAALQKAVRYNYQTAAARTLSDRCTHCHVQAQALVSGELTRRLTDYDAYAKERGIILNSLTTHQQIDGAVDGHSMLGIFKRDQSEFGIWALNTWHKPSEIASTLAKLAKFIVDTQSADGSWVADYVGWWTTPVAHASLNIKGLTDASKTLNNLSAGSAVNHALVPITTTGISIPYHLASDAVGDVYASNYGAGTVQVIKADGTTYQYLGGLTNPTAVAFANDGTAYISAQGGLYRRAINGEVTAISALRGSGLAIGPDGNIYMSSYWDNTIYKFTPGGAASVHISGGALRDPWGIAFTPAGELLVANYGARNVVRYRADLSSDIPVGWTNGAPIGLQMTSDGWLVSTDTGLYRYNNDWHGERLVYRATGGITQTSDGRIVVGDNGNTVYRLTSTPIGMPSLLNGMGEAIGKTTAWLLQDGNTDSNNNLFVAQRLIGLNAAKLYYRGQPMADTLLAKMLTVAALLRSRVQSDGGWGYTPGHGSDSMVTAQVGVALDALNPSAADPIVQNAVRLLLSRQHADGTWYSENGIMSTPLAATTWVAIWLPIVLDRLGGVDTDLSVTFPANVKMTNPDLVPSTTMLNVDGTTTNVWKLVGVTSAGRTINYDLSLQDMALNEVRPVSTDARLAFRNTFTGGLVNAPIDIPRVTASAFLGLGVTTDRVTYSQDTAVSIVGQVNNTGLALSKGSVKFEIYAPDNRLVASIGSRSFDGIAAGDSVNLAVGWNTGKTLAATDYYVLGSLYDSNNSFVGSAKANFAIQAGQSQFNSARITTDRSSYTGAQTVQLTAQVSNLTSNLLQADLRSRTTVLGSNGASAFSQTEAIAQLVAGGQRQYTYSLPAAGLAPGSYSTQLQLLNAQGTVLAQNTGTFTVQPTDQSGVGLSGTLQANPVSTVAGGTVALSASVRNLGNAAISNAALTISIVDPTAQRTIASWPYSAPVAQGASFGMAPVWNTTGSAPNTYVAVLSTTLGGSSQTLATANIVVTGSSTKPSVTQSALRQGRLLLLVSCRNGEDGYADQGTVPVEIPDAGPGADDAKCTASRVAFVKKLLATAGVPHYVTANVDDFTYALRSGQFNIYWISGGADKLTDGLALEIREAVNRGDGLLVDGVHDARNKLLDEVVGLEYRGDLLTINLPITFTMDPLTGATLQTTGRPLKYKMGNSALVAKFPSGIRCPYCPTADERNGTNTATNPANPAIVGNAYGRGKGVRMAFDLIGSIQNQPGNPNWNAALKQTFDFLLPEVPEPYTSGAYAAVRTTVGNTAPQTTSFRVAYTVPTGGKALMADPYVPLQTGAPQAQWDFSLAASQSKDLTLYLRAPTSTGRHFVGTAVNLMAGGQISLPGSYPFALQVVAASDAVATSKLITDLNALAFTASRDQQSRDQAVRSLQAALAPVRPELAITQLLAAVDTLRLITSKDMSAYRLQINRWMQELAYQWQTAQPLRNIP
jgi:hypothetical protein